MNTKLIAECIVKEAGFESHLERALDALKVPHDKWTLEKKRKQNVLIIEGYDTSKYIELAKNLRPDFNALYDTSYKGLVFQPVDTLFVETKF